MQTKQLKTEEMNKTEFNKRWFWRRLIAFPFVFALILIVHLSYVLQRTFHFLKYGGEFVNYEENESESIAGIFEMLKDIMQNQKERDYEND